MWQTWLSVAALVVAAVALYLVITVRQALVGHGSGAADAPLIRKVTSRLVRFGLVGGAAIGALLALATPVLVGVFTTDRAVLDALVPALLLTAAALPLAGYVFVLDGVLIGAGDGRYLALAGVFNLLVYLLALIGALALAPADPAGRVAILWLALGIGMLGARAVTLGLRARGSAWITLGASASR